jgi:hypothetical protein
MVQSVVAPVVKVTLPVAPAPLNPPIVSFDEYPSSLVDGRALAVIVNVYSSALPIAEVPEPVVTVTSTEPMLSAGVTAVSDVLLFTVYEGAAIPPKLTPRTLEKLVPEMVTSVPVLAGPDFGDTDATVGVVLTPPLSTVIVIGLVDEVMSLCEIASAERVCTPLLRYVVSKEKFPEPLPT